MRIVCDYCEHEWTLAREHIKEGPAGKWEGQSLSAQYFRCPECSERHVIAYYTRRIIRMLEKQREMTERLLKEPEAADTLMPKINAIRQRLRDQQAAIKKAKGET